MKELIKKLNAGTIYLKPHAICAYIDVEAIDALMKKAADALDELSKKREPLGERIEVPSGNTDYMFGFIDGIKYAEKSHGIGVSDE